MTAGGDFNYVLVKTDVTGHLNYCRALNEIVQRIDLVDTWATAPERGVYTNYTRQGASRLDRIYVSRNLRGRKCGTETVVTEFTDHVEVALLIALNVTTVRRGRGYWRTNATLLRVTFFQEKLRQRWAGWVQQQKYSPNIFMWWESRKDSNTQTLHKWRHRATKRCYNIGKFLPRMLIWCTRAPAHSATPFEWKGWQPWTALRLKSLNLYREGQ